MCDQILETIHNIVINTNQITPYYAIESDNKLKKYIMLFYVML